MGELVQLLVADVETEDGIPFVHITDGGGKSVKTSTSRRRVPVHPELVRCGFLEYVAGMRATGAERLFPAIVAGPGRTLAAAFSQWFTRHREVLGLTDPRKLVHSFRHGFKDACRRCAVPSEHHDRMTGHGGRTVGDSYGAEYFPLRPLAESMARVRYEGLDLSHLRRHKTKRLIP